MDNKVNALQETTKISQFAYNLLRSKISPYQGSRKDVKARKNKYTNQKKICQNCKTTEIQIQVKCIIRTTSDLTSSASARRASQTSTIRELMMVKAKLLLNTALLCMMHFFLLAVQKHLNFVTNFK